MPSTPFVAAYGPDIPTEADLRLLGDVKGKRVLDLGCGDGAAAVSFALAGATVVAIDPSSEHLATTRARADEAEVRLELRTGDVADLAFLRADSIDGCFAAGSLAAVDDLGRVFRQVHRVLKVGAPLAFSLPHPAWEVLTAGRSWFDRSPVRDADGTILELPRPVSDLYASLVRASYRVDALLEPEPVPHAPRSASWDPRMATVPRTLVVRARKEGS